MSKRILKGFVAGALALSLFCLDTNNSVKAASVQSDNKVYMLYDKSTSKYTVQSYFNPSHKVESGEGYNLTVGKYVKQAYVRAQSPGRTTLGVKICSSYDSGRSYSAAAESKSDIIMSTPEEGTKDCKTCSQKLNYGWIYFE